MFYYFVWVRSSRYHGNEALTYASTDRLKTGAIVRIELQNELVSGIVIGTTSRPRFKTKTIADIYPLPPLPDYLLKLGRWLHDYYPSSLGTLTQQLLPVIPSVKHVADFKFDQVKNVINTADLPQLSEEQKYTIERISDAGSYLIAGKTGSGKTRLYIELALQALQSRKSAIILTPEISLTTQLEANFRAVFGNAVMVMHSQQTVLERQKSWLRSLLSEKPLIVIGPRSALFSPLQKIGLIVLDEAHEAAYKQETAPQYQSGRVAAQLASLTRSVLVLGSATPSINDTYLAKQKNRPILYLNQLAQPKAITKKSIIVVDRKEHEAFTRSSQLSTVLIDAIQSSLDNHQQSLLYLNRRGTARLIMCENCGWQANCPNCDIPLIYHNDSHSLRCHSCNYHAKAPNNCPVCANPSIVFKTAGTKAIVEEVRRLFPSAIVARFDADNLRSERFDTQYAAIRNGSVDILVGTQLLAKGLDLPLLSTLGVLLAETSLYLPDFSSQERTFQLISQVLGRIGRGHVAGTAIIQTYHPDHPVLKAALESNYEAFYNSELLVRQQFLFPPFCYLLKLSVRRATSASAEKAAMKCKEMIENNRYRVRIEGPAPSFYERVHNKFQWQLIVKAKERAELLGIIEHLPSNWSYDIDPIDLL